MLTNHIHQKALLLLMTTVTLAFGWILLPFYSAVFWGVVLAILFAPMQRKLLIVLRMRKNVAAILTLLICLLLVIMPLSVLAAALVQEGTAFYQRIQSGELNIAAYFKQMVGLLPRWAIAMLERVGMANFGALQAKLAQSLGQGSQVIATQVVHVGQNTLNFVVSFGVMLYLLFYLLRDGAALSKEVEQAIPLSPEHKRHLIRKFATVIRATVRGNIVVACIQGALGGMIFATLGIQGAILWGALMAFLSLLPAIGAALVWGPVAAYFLVTGDVGKGFILLGFGVFVIGLVDNLLRPILVGKDIQMPDYLVLISTLGGLAVFGLNGFVIGPVIAALFVSAWDLFSTTQSPKKISEPAGPS
ncbi:MAG: family transporter [Paucimonas sp.]|jgi:predicted PurR-regulated permease PerM|nr:family transporter [Paucimonas sp.]